MADFDSVMQPYREEYPDYEFLNLKPKRAPIEVTTRNPANAKQSAFDMPVPYIDAEMDALVALSVLEVQ
jgi:hypothetical protein